MTNIQKLAVEIFQAPTLQELIERQKSNIIQEVITVEEIDALVNSCMYFTEDEKQKSKIAQPLKKFVSKETTYLVSDSQSRNGRILQILLDRLEWKLVAETENLNWPRGLSIHKLYESTDGNALHWEKDTGASTDIVFLSSSFFEEERKEANIQKLAAEILTRFVGKPHYVVKVPQWGPSYKIVEVAVSHHLTLESANAEASKRYNREKRNRKLQGYRDIEPKHPPSVYYVDAKGKETLQ